MLSNNRTFKISGFYRCFDYATTESFTTGFKDFVINN